MLKRNRSSAPLRFSAGRVAEGDFRALPMDRQGDELADLTSTLNETAAHLARTIRMLTDERNRSAAILRSMVEGVAIIAPNRRLTFCSESFCRALAVESASWRDRPIAEVIRQSDLLDAIRKALGGNETVQSQLVVGTVRIENFAVTTAPVCSNGSTAGAVMVHDIMAPAEATRWSTRIDQQGGKTRRVWINEGRMRDRSSEFIPAIAFRHTILSGSAIGAAGRGHYHSVSEAMKAGQEFSPPD